MNLNDYGNFVSSLACHSERSEESLDCLEAGRKKSEMFRFTQHDKSKKLGIELYENLALQCTRSHRVSFLRLRRVLANALRTTRSTFAAQVDRLLRRRCQINRRSRKLIYEIASRRYGHVLIMLLLLWPATLFAHTRGGEAIGFASGFEHPISGWDHVLAMVAVGLWGAQLGPPAVWLLPVTFPMVMAFGGMLGLMGVKLPGVEVCIALSAIALGLMVLREAKPNLLAAAFLVGFFAIFHGHAHGTELPPGANGLLYSIGFVIATGLLHVTGIAIGTIHRWPKGRVALRVAGAVVMAGGAMFLWGALT
jgi:urease accessory protein